MRSVLVAALLCVLVLAACGGASQPTATPIPPTASTESVVSGDNALATLAATVGAPQPGTLVVPTQQDTAQDAAAPLMIDSLTFTQTGGIAGISLSIELRGDGTLIRDSTTTAVSQGEVQKIAALLESVHFYDLQGTFTGRGGAADTYRYTLTVNSPQGSRMIVSEDGMTPPELYQVYDAIRSLSNS